MTEVELYLSAHPILVWMALGAVLLATELHTGSGWLLWPAGSAAVTGGATLILSSLDPPGQIVAFAALTVISTYAGRRFLRPEAHQRSDVNETHARVIGHAGKVVADFQAGLGRVFVDGKEWSAENETGGALTKGAVIEVVAVLGGARLRVRRRG